MNGHTAKVLLQLCSDIGAIRASEQTKPGGLTCDDHDFLLVAGPIRSELPSPIVQRLAQHERGCDFHSRPGWAKGLIDVGVTPDMEEAALKLIGKLLEEQ